MTMYIPELNDTYLVSLVDYNERGKIYSCQPSKTDSKIVIGVVNGNVTVSLKTSSINQALIGYVERKIGERFLQEQK